MKELLSKLFEQREEDEVKKGNPSMSELVHDLKVAIQRYNENAKKEWGGVVKAVNAFVEAGGNLSTIYDWPSGSDLLDEVDEPAFATAWIYSRLEGKRWDEGTSKRIRKALGYL